MERDSISANYWEVRYAKKPKADRAKGGNRCKQDTAKPQGHEDRENGSGFSTGSGSAKEEVNHFGTNSRRNSSLLIIASGNPPRLCRGGSSFTFHGVGLQACVFLNVGTMQKMPRCVSWRWALAPANMEECVNECCRDQAPLRGQRRKTSGFCRKIII